MNMVYWIQWMYWNNLFKLLYWSISSFKTNILLKLHKNANASGMPIRPSCEMQYNNPSQFSILTCQDYRWERERDGQCSKVNNVIEMQMGQWPPKPSEGQNRACQKWLIEELMSSTVNIRNKHMSSDQGCKSVATSVLID